MARQEGGCKLLILSSISSLVNKLLQEEKARFSSTVIVSPRAAGSWGVRERVSQRIILIAMANADRVSEAKEAKALSNQGRWRGRSEAPASGVVVTTHNPMPSGKS